MSAPQLNVLALLRSNDVRDAVATALADRHGTVLDVQLRELKALDGGVMAAVAKADVLLLDVDAQDEPELAALRRIVDEQKGRASILATTADVSPAAMRQLVRQGIDDFIPQPVAAQDVLDAIDLAARKLRQRRNSGRPPGKVLAFTRAKGGMGATTLALHTALSLQRPARRRDPPKQVCVLDLDLQLGDAALTIDLEVKHDTLEVIRAPQRLDGALLRGAMVQHKSGLSVFPAPLQPVPLEALLPQTATQIIELARDEFDYVVIDLPMAITQWLEPVIGAVDELLLVTQLNVPAVRRTRRLLDEFHDAGLLNLPVSVVLNRYVWRLGERSRLQQSAKALGRSIDHFVPNDDALALEAANRGVPIYDIRRRSRMGRAISAMADQCVKKIAERAASAQATG